MSLFKLIQTITHPRDEKMIYEQCSNSNNTHDLDIYETDDLGLLKLIHCTAMAKKTKEDVRY